MHRRWIGRYLIATAVLHGAAVVPLYGGTVSDMILDGLIATADDHSPRAAAYWFAAFAPFLAVAGLLVDVVEDQNMHCPAAVPMTMIAALVVMVVVMPATGAWLLFPPALALLSRSWRVPRRQAEREAM